MICSLHVFDGSVTTLTNQQHRRTDAAWQTLQAQQPALLCAVYASDTDTSCNGKEGRADKPTYRHLLKINIQHVEVGVGHGWPYGEGADPLIVTTISQPMAHPYGGFRGAIEVDDLGVRE